MRRMLRAMVVAGMTISLAPSAVFADYAVLSNSGVVRGRSTAFRGDKGASLVVFETPTGGRVTLEQSEIRQLTRRSFALEEHEIRVKVSPSDQVDSLWELAEWCREKGLKSERAAHLLQIVAIDPDHLRARQGLGQSFRDGQWKTHDEEMRSRGYVKRAGRYVTPQELVLRDQIEARKKAELDWSAKIRLGLRLLRGNSPEKSRRALEDLMSINDEHALSGLNRHLLKSKDEQDRLLYVRILGRMDISQVIPLLVDRTLFDASKDVRLEARETITEPRYSTARPLYVRELRNADNEVLRRAASMLGRCGDQSVIPELIESLITVHKEPVQVVDRSNTYSFGTNGSFGSSPDQVALPPDVAQKLAAGQYPNGVIVIPPPSALQVRTVNVRRRQENPEVLEALQSLSKMSFGYNQDEWRQWWAVKRVTAHPTGAPPSRGVSGAP